MRHKEVIAGKSRCDGYGTFAPRIICVGADLPAVFVIDTDYVAEYVLVEEVVTEFSVFVFARAVLDTGRRAVFIVDEVEEILYVVLRPSLGDDPAAIECVFVLDPAYRLARAYSVGVVRACPFAPLRLYYTAVGDLK